MVTTGAASGNAIATEFESTGVVRLDAALTADQAEGMRDVVWRYAERKIGLRHDDRSTWPDGSLPISWKGLKRNHAFEPLTNNTAVVNALDTIFGPDGWEPPKPGAQILLSLPRPGRWTLPDAWHMDCGFEHPTRPTFLLKLFAFFGPVEPMGGGTMLLPGSHRVVERYRETIPSGTGGGRNNWRAFMKHDPWLAQLLDGKRLPDGGRSLIGQRHEVDACPLKSSSSPASPATSSSLTSTCSTAFRPNTAERPRQMFGKGIAARRAPTS